MATNIYVGNLPWSTTTDDLYAMFQQYGAVTRAQIVQDRETGRSRGFGFVEMATGEEANAAVSRLNGSELDGRQIKVEVAKPAGSGGGQRRGGGGGGFGGGGRGGGGWRGDR